MVNSGYTPRHSTAPSLKIARRQWRAVEQAVARKERRSAASRVQITIISATALALVAIVTYFATMAEPSTVQDVCAGSSCASADGTVASRPPTGLPSVRVLRGGRYSLDGPSAVMT